jgi:hypothetical protein
MSTTEDRANGADAAGSSSRHHRPQGRQRAVPGPIEGPAANENVQPAAGAGGGDVEQADAVDGEVVSTQVGCGHSAIAVLDQIREHGIELPPLKLVGGPHGSRPTQG